MHECLPKLSRNSLSKFESTGHLHLRRVGRKQVDTFNASPPCYHQIKTSRQVDTFNASPPYHQIKTIHQPCRNICTYTCIHASNRRTVCLHGRCLISMVVGTHVSTRTCMMPGPCLLCMHGWCPRCTRSCLLVRR